MIAAFSFLLHFSAIGSIYSEWLDPVVDYDVNISSLLDSVKSLPPPPPIEEPTEKPDENPTESKAEAPKAQAKASGTPGKAGAMSNAQAAALSNQLEQMEMATLGALSGAGPATEGVLKTGEVPTSALDKAAASSAGVGVGGLSLGGWWGNPSRIRRRWSRSDRLYGNGRGDGHRHGPGGQGASRKCVHRSGQCERWSGEQCGQGGCRDARRIPQLL
jgi:predicted flap endonuclease-1-like 5' DNA nuclease